MRPRIQSTVGVVAVGVIVLSLVFLVRVTRPSKPTTVGDVLPISSTMIHAVMKQAATEGARICADAGGAAVLVVPDGQGWYRQTLSASYEDGFRAGLQDHQSLQLAGLYFAPPACRDTQFIDHRIPNLARLQDIRKTYPQARVIVSPLGLPQLTDSEEREWLASNPPKLVVIELAGVTNSLLARRVIEAGIAQVVIACKDPETGAPLNPPGNPETIIRDYFDILRAN